MTDADTRFLFGGPVDEVELNRRNDILPHAFKRALRDSGAGKLLEQMSLNVDELPDDGIPIAFGPDWAKDVMGSEQAGGFDLISLLAHQFAEKRADDERYEKATDRWRKVPDRIKGYIPGDAGSWRWTLMASKIMRPLGSDSEPVEEFDIHRRAAAGVGASYAYLGTPFFIPAQIALDVVTAVPPPPRQRDEIRLPARYVTMFHDGIPLSLLTGTDDEIDAYEEGGRVMRDDSLLIGGMLAANDDMTLDTKLAFMVVAAPGPGNTGYGWRSIPIPMDIVSPATNVFWNYAALLAWENWGIPAKVPHTQGKERSRGYYRTIARSPEGEQGAHQGVRVLDYRPPTLKDLRDAEGAPQREFKYQHDRTSYWKRRIRVGIRDENDQLVGPVYGPDAVEGVTFERRGRLIPRSVVREDLPKRPDAEKVYRLPDTIQQIKSEA